MEDAGAFEIGRPGYRPDEHLIGRRRQGTACEEEQRRSGRIGEEPFLSQEGEVDQGDRRQALQNGRARRHGMYVFRKERRGLHHHADATALARQIGGDVQERLVWAAPRTRRPGLTRLPRPGSAGAPNEGPGRITDDGVEGAE